jgi:hypothetical protein
MRPIVWFFFLAACGGDTDTDEDTDAAALPAVSQPIG